MAAGNGLLKEADRLDRIDRGVSFQPKKSANWKTADDLEMILELGSKFVPRRELEAMLVAGGCVKGETEEKKRESAKLAITIGLDKRYLVDASQGIGWVPGVRKSKVRRRYSL